MKRPSQAGIFFPAVIRLVPAALLLVGCIGPNGEDAAARLRRCQKENESLKANVQYLQAELIAGQEQIRTLQALGDKRMDLLFSVSDITIGKYTAGVDLDDKDGQDGVRVYLTPIDRDGHALKAAGSVKIQMFDLAAKENMVAECNFPVERISEQWSGGFMAYHYRFDCPWGKQPEHDELTVRVEFTDYLTGKTFTAQKVCRLKLTGPSPAVTTNPAK